MFVRQNLGREWFLGSGECSLESGIGSRMVEPHACDPLKVGLPGDSVIAYRLA